jgi:tRNA-specific 2-thiouridylase
MSGGVDSSVAAWLLREQGYDVVGLFMRHGQEPAVSSVAAKTSEGSTDATVVSQLAEACDGPACETGSACAAGRQKQGCCSAADAADARRVADMLHIPFYAVNFQKEFDRIVEYFVQQYLAGRTPNPCIVCNTWLKFGKLVEYADAVGAEFIATGHYARLVRSPQGECSLCRGLDASKDQSYVLFGIDPKLLPRLLFPVGDYCKDAIREMAGKLGLAVAAKRDSQEICFVPDQDHAKFIRQRCGNADRSGEFVTTAGAVVGRHEGIEQFTVGQRKGLGLAFGEPRYIVRIEPDTRRVVLGTHEELARTELTASKANWLTPTGEPPVSSNSVTPDSVVSDSSLSFRAHVKIRYRSRPTPATITILPGNRFHVAFDEPCHGVAPGQAAVCYDGDRVLGGGWIESS